MKWTGNRYWTKCGIWTVLLIFSVDFGTGIAQRSSDNASQNNHTQLDQIISPDHRIQSSFDKIMSGEVERRKEIEARLGSDYIREHTEKQIGKTYFETLIQEVGGRKAFLRQVLYFIVNTEGVKAMLLPLVYESLSLPIQTLFDVAIPYIDSKHSGLREKVKEIMRGLSQDKETSSRDFGRFENYLKTHPDKRETRVLVKYMYEFETNKALETVLEVFGPDLTDQERKTVRSLHNEIKKLLKRKEHLQEKRSSNKKPQKNGLENEIENTNEAIIDQLIELTEIQRWWVQLYVAERIRSDDALRNDRLIEALMDHSLIKRRLSGDER